jgi:hypothetical protein
MQVATIGLDLAKHVFQIHGIDAAEKVGDDRESPEPYVYGLREAIKIQANLAAST